MYYKAVIMCKKYVVKEKIVTFAKKQLQSMRKKDILNYTVEEISLQLDPLAMRHFILTDAEKKIPEDLLEYPHALDGIIFSVCTRGSARFKINMQEFHLQPGMTVTILPNTIVEPVEKTIDFSLSTLLFSFDFIADLSLYPHHDLFDIIEQCPCLNISEEDFRYILKYHAFIVEQYNRKDHRYRQEIAKYLLFAFLAEICALYQSRETSNTTQMEHLAGRFLSILRKNYKEERHLSFYAEKMCLTPKYLTSTIKKITGKSILVWIHEAVIASAKVQLKSSKKTVVQISEELNFADSSLFCRFFKKYTGMTPNQYREHGAKVLIR